MASSDENMERFAHDVCVHVLEKFGIFKVPDDTRKRIKYVCHDFLSRISRSVVSFAIWLRTDFKNSLEDRCKIADLGDIEIMWIFDNYIVLNENLCGAHWAEKMYISFALCTEYIQFARTRDYAVSLNKLVIGWGEFFKKHLRIYFDEDGGFPGLYNYLKISQIGQLGDFQEAFISEYCLPYGAIECNTKLAKECIEKQGFNIPLEKTIFGIKTLGHYFEVFFRKMERVKLEKSANEDLLHVASLESKLEKMSDSEKDSSSSSAKSDEKTSQHVGSDQAPKHGETCSGTSDSEEDSSSSSDKSDRETSQHVSSTARQAPKHEETCSGTSDSEEDSSSSSAKSDGKTSRNVDGNASDSEIMQNNLLGIPPHEETLREIDPFFVENIPSPPKARSSSKSPERESGPSDDIQLSSKSSERKSRLSDVLQSSSKSPESQSASSYASPEMEEFKERVEQIISKLEQDMEELKALLHKNCLLPMKSGRRGSRMRVKDAKNKFPPKDPEGLI